MYPQKLALTSLTGDSCSVGIVHSRTKATAFFFNVLYTPSPPLTAFLSAPTSHGSTSYWLPFPTSPSNPTYPTGIYTLYIMSLTFFIHLHMKMEPIRISETSAIKIQTPGNYPKRNILQLKNGESLKTRTFKCFFNRVGLRTYQHPCIRNLRSPGPTVATEVLRNILFFGKT